MLRRRVVYSSLKYVFACPRLQHQLDIFLVEWKLFGELVRFTEDIDRLLEVLCDERRPIRAHLVDNAAIGQDSLATHKDTVNVGHCNGHTCVIYLLAFNTEGGAFLTDDLTCATWHPFCCDHFDAEAALAHSLDHVQYHTRVAMH